MCHNLVIFRSIIAIMVHFVLLLFFVVDGFSVWFSLFYEVVRLPIESAQRVVWRGVSGGTSAVGNVFRGGAPYIHPNFVFRMF